MAVAGAEQYCWWAVVGEGMSALAVDPDWVRKFFEPARPVRAPVTRDNHSLPRVARATVLMPCPG